MIGLALRSIAHRRTAFAATFVAVLLGTMLIGSFATLLGTATGPMTTPERETLIIMGAIVGGWGAAIVLFSLVSTVGITVGQRAAEVWLLRTIGATPAQIRRLVQAEVLVVCLIASVLGALVAALTGWLLLEALRAADLIGDAVGYRGTVESLALTVAGVLVVCLAAAAIAGRRATRGPASAARSTPPAGRISPWRLVTGVVLVAYGIGAAIVTITVTAHSDDPYDAMISSGASSIVVAIGLAILAPTLLRVAARLLRPLLGSSAAGYLAAYNTSRRARLLAGVLGPVIVLSAASIGTLMLTGIDARTTTGIPADAVGTITLVNTVIAGMLSLFAAIMVINSFASSIAHRRLELRRLWMLGATARQVRLSVVTEAAVVSAAGIVLGVAASLTTVVPFSIARGEGAVPDGQLWLPFAIAVAAAVLTLVSARVAVGRGVPTAA